VTARLKRVLPHGVLLAAAAVLYWMATRIEVETGGRISPAVWPKTVIVVMALLCGYEIVKRLLAKDARSATGLLGGIQSGPAAQRDPPDAAPEHPRKLAGGIALVAGYVVLVPWLGFFVSTAAFLAVFPWIGGLRRPALCAAIALAGSLALIVIFMRVAYVSLPLGAGPFRELSILMLRVLGVT
jgi:putative tricarboxylic transport membrane protein